MPVDAIFWFWCLGIMLPVLIFQFTLLEMGLSFSCRLYSQAVLSKPETLY